ncbi:MAG: Isomerizing Glutamine-fructose-6-phosphate aminotransferase [Parcubacteria group bacterium GW2011_GWC2_42_12]|uniref:Glutamine--fructose-6-phosphate aminotransferase [isomerizing] n=1 Tax=Candidatus Falkowbacteria bacterium RIFCSPHIGHO2_02_FULL_42_9 TaxID=1797986 RepID=A0A1F5S900_9BACT|nr:MAG: Isomerizing Glutamine-fructose-6-phosphate aminotransferase [Parcubacteria group bacterium GW2011_GWC2_42_12]OGF23185.1 MAG: glutamine--fructose-6-phosphate aminotransferase [Candidatus Falkowbacteria bacterium RIFCSPHIGHO2_02_FULL_42_9]
MCGIVGYIGKNQALPILLDGLKRLEYRGYDSAGVAVKTADGVFSAKAIGKIVELEKKIGEIKSPFPCPLVPRSGRRAPLLKRANTGIAHTRWATHGAPTEANAHPQTDCQGKIWLAHNGIIENYQELKTRLAAKGHKFISETDTEVIAHLLEDLYDGNLTATLIKVLKILKGTYGLAVLHRDEPNKLLAAKRGSPLVIGLADGEFIIASDAAAIIRHTKQVIYLNDGEIAEISDRDFKIFDADNNQVDKNVDQIEWDQAAAEKGGWPHFMLKEIFEQPESIANSLRGRFMAEAGRVKLGGLEGVAERIRQTNKIIIVGCGTARLAGLVGEYMMEEYAGVPTEVDYAHEFRYRKAVLDEQTALIAISQSGETADTLAAVQEAKEKGCLTLGVVNVVGSSIARETDAGVYSHSGPEIAVASTKAFTSQIAILVLFTVMFGRQRQMSLATGQRIINELIALPDKIRQVLALNDEIKRVAEKYYKFKNFAFLGRKYNHPIAFEGAIKLKEISYVHAEGFASGEMKHGPIALIDENFPSLVIAPLDSVYEKNYSSLQEIKARGGKVIAITTAGNGKIKAAADEVIYIPKTLEMLTPILVTVPLQLFAYQMAILNGRDVDKPRNLAKSVTVE